MRKIYSLFIITVILISCGEKKIISIESLVSTGTLTELKEKKKEIASNLETINKDLEAINRAISKKDTVKKLPLITTFTTKTEVFNHYLEIQGNVKTKQNILVYPEIPGILRKILVKEGQRVSKGQLLAVIDDGGLSNQVAQLEATTQLAKTTFERQKRLWEEKIGSEIQFLQTKTNYEAQRNSLQQLKSQQSKASIRAPFSGVIDDVLKEPGTVIAPGQGSEVFRIVNLKNMYVEAEVPEKYIASITKNKEVKVAFPVLGETLISQIKQVGSFINPNNRSFKIEVTVANKSGNVKPNLTAKLQINDYTKMKAILIPQSIISENAKGEQFIYVLKDKKPNNEAVAARLIIETGKTQGDMIEVTKNLSENAEVIMEGARSVNNGQVVKVINK
ncbi:MAG: efflux RND transporter periplasmic adaptor subunit [Polaribacter sp.]|jgi:membrane fusion protein (multidrug efflux system)|uniref:efflux RND transporter periplasmic adaptor subunit n=1 Tax=Polaribacter sp. TaxID=1920175 RepID=UPI00261BB59A|nr:efflux RND transporter periplasmic adaptor subunit [Polaribacter sp.]MBT3741202.1 efflux RND transporter periplasmic adaptor subunit [Polaribacter sp.]MDG1194412.1 efflux RND transporter periplasmic adaptor subunit [Polaribacter sp.]MDG1402300.1 efflux RND transporter periplasmic adaptor subunit [Polaribacter sp.]MDG2436397.1 efflux RND transporter periplasmic adaptor subunit [Polaribacter sp.]